MKRSIDVALDDHDRDDDDAIEGEMRGDQRMPQKRSNREQKFQGVEENHFQSSKFRRNETHFKFFMKTVECVCIRRQQEREHIVYAICICIRIYRQLTGCVCTCICVTI